MWLDRYHRQERQCCQLCNWDKLQVRRRKSHSQNSFFLFVKKTTREKRCNSNLEKILKNQACKLHFWEKAGNKPLKWRLSKQHSSFRSAITPTGKLGRQHFHAHKTSREKGGSKKIKHTVLCSTYSLSLFITREYFFPVAPHFWHCRVFRCTHTHVHITRIGVSTQTVKVGSPQVSTKFLLQVTAARERTNKKSHTEVRKAKPQKKNNNKRRKLRNYEQSSSYLLSCCFKCWRNS